MSEAQLPASQRERYVNASLQNSVATLQWSCDSAQGKADALGWVDSRIEGFHRSFSVQESRGSRQYRHRPYGAYLPRTMRMAAQYAQENGEPTVLEGLLLLFCEDGVVGGHTTLLLVSNESSTTVVGHTCRSNGYRQ